MFQCCYQKNVYKSRAHSLVYFHSVSSQFYTCIRPHREHVVNVHNVHKTDKFLLILQMSDTDKFQVTKLMAENGKVLA